MSVKYYVNDDKCFKNPFTHLDVKIMPSLVRLSTSFCPCPYIKCPHLSTRNNRTHLYRGKK